MKRKLWYSLEESAQLLDCNSEDILHFGVIGKLKIGFDWLVIQELARSKSPACGFEFYYRVDDFFVGPGAKVNTRLNPLRRIAILNPTDIQKIKHHGHTIIESALVGTLRMDVNDECDGYDDSNSPFLINRNTILVPNYSIKSFQATPDAKNQEYCDHKEQEPTHQQKKQINTLLKIIALYAKALAEQRPNIKTQNGTIKLKEAARLLHSHLPDNTYGLSDKSITTYTSQGLRLLSE